nr:immunoglobulin light chain junction region [Macaca mulatta]
CQRHGNWPQHTF